MRRPRPLSAVPSLTLPKPCPNLNRVGHDFDRVQVGKGRFTYKGRLCFLRGERPLLKQLLGKPCSAALHSVFPLPATVATPTPDEPESFFMVTHPHLKTILSVGVETLTKIIKPCWIKNYRSAQINELSVRKWTFVRRLTLRVATRWRGPILKARQACLSSVPQLNEQVRPKVTLDLVPQNNRVISKVTWSLTTEPLPPTTQPAQFLILEQEILSGRKCSAISWTLQRRWKLKPNWPWIP